LHRSTYVFLLILLTIISSCNSEENIRDPKINFLLTPGTASGQLGMSKLIKSNYNIIPLQFGRINFNNGQITIIDSINKKIMVFSPNGKLNKEIKLPKSKKKHFYNSLTVDQEGRIFFISTINKAKGKIFNLWQIYKNKTTKISTLKPLSKTTSNQGITTRITSIPTGLIALNDEELAIIWKSRIVHTKKNRMGQNEYLNSIFTVTRLVIFTHENQKKRSFDLQPAFFKNKAGSKYSFNRIDTIKGFSDGKEVLINASFKSKKNKSIFRKIIFSVSLKDGTAKEIPLANHTWSGIIGISDSDQLYLFDRVYNKDYKTRALISIWRLNGSKMTSFVIESDPASSILGGLFLSRNGTLFSYKRIKNDIYSKKGGIQFLSWQ